MKFIKRFAKLNYLWKTLFIISGISVYFLLCAIGTGVPSIKYESKIMSITNLTKDSKITHLVIDEIDGNSCVQDDEARKIVQYFNKYKNRYRPYTIVDNKYSLNFKGGEYNTSLCSLNYYNDSLYTEYLNIPLYLSNSSIKNGAEYGADYASYIPSSMADSMLKNLNLNSYDDLLSIKEPFYINVNGSEKTFSIRNIYLNNTTTNWNRIESDDYYKFFGERNPGSILVSASSLFNQTRKEKLVFDVNTSYGNLDKIIKKCNSALGNNLNYQATNQENQTYEFLISTDGFKNGFFVREQTPYFIALIVVIFFQSILLIYSDNLRVSILKCLFVIIAFFSLFGTGIEIAKSIKTFDFNLYFFFNYVGTILYIFYISIVVIIYLIFSLKMDKKNATPNN